MPFDIMLSVEILSDVTMSVAMLCAIMLCVVMPCNIMLSISSGQCCYIEFRIE